MINISFKVGKSVSFLTVAGLIGASGYFAYRAIQNEKKLEAHKRDILNHTPVLTAINNASFGNEKIELPEDRAFIKNHLMKKYERAKKAGNMKDFDERIEELINLCTDLTGDKAADHLAYIKLLHEENKQKEANDISLQQAKEIANAITSVGDRLLFANH